jgi:hypothetical protein
MAECRVRTISWDDGMMIQWKVPGLPSTVAGPEAVHSASFKLGWKEKVKLKQLAEATSRCTTSFALKQTRVSGALLVTTATKTDLRGMGVEEKENLFPPWRHATNSPDVSLASLTRRLFWFLTSLENVTFS